MVLLGHSATSSQAPITCKFRFPFSAPAPRKRTRPHLASITTDKRRVTAAEVCELWASTEFRQCSQDKAALALEHSYAVAAALLPSHPGTERGSTPRLVGFARAISDGAFAALIVDVVVHPDLRRRGLGRKLMSALARECLSRGATSCLVFAPRDRLFFWKSGFRLGSRYKVMGIP